MSRHLKSDQDKKKLEQEILQGVLNGLLREEDNRYCADCGSKGPRWVSWSIGIFLCIRCAGIHRNLGVHLSKVKSVNLDSWTPEQVQSMCVMGNTKAKAVYEARMPDHFRRPQSDQALESFIRQKYEHKKFIISDWQRPKVDPSDLPCWRELLDIQAGVQPSRKATEPGMKKAQSGIIRRPEKMARDEKSESNLSAASAQKPVKASPNGQAPPKSEPPVADLLLDLNSDVPVNKTKQPQSPTKVALKPPVQKSQETFFHADLDGLNFHQPQFTPTMHTVQSAPNIADQNERSLFDDNVPTAPTKKESENKVQKMRTDILSLYGTGNPTSIPVGQHQPNWTSQPPYGHQTIPQMLPFQQQGIATKMGQMSLGGNAANPNFYPQLQQQPRYPAPTSTTAGTNIYNLSGLAPLNQDTLSGNLWQ